MASVLLAIPRREPSSDRSHGEFAGRLYLFYDDNVTVQRPSADPVQDRRRRLNQRLRQAFIDGAEEESLRRIGGGLTVEELERVLRRYPVVA